MYMIKAHENKIRNLEDPFWQDINDATIDEVNATTMGKSKIKGYFSRTVDCRSVGDWQRSERAIFLVVKVKSCIIRILRNILKE